MASPCTKLLVGGSGEHKQQPEMRGTDVGLYDFFFIRIKKTEMVRVARLHERSSSGSCFELPRTSSSSSLFTLNR